MGRSAGDILGSIHQQIASAKLNNLAPIDVMLGRMQLRTLESTRQYPSPKGTEEITVFGIPIRAASCDDLIVLNVRI